MFAADGRLCPLFRSTTLVARLERRDPQAGEGLGVAAVATPSLSRQVISENPFGLWGTSGFSVVARARGEEGPAPAWRRRWAIWRWARGR